MTLHCENLVRSYSIVKRSLVALTIFFAALTAALGDLKPGWVVSVTAKHEGGNEVAETVKVVLEK